MDYSSLYFTKEIQDYLHSCENLLAALSAANTASRISMEEREMLAYSVSELQKVLVVWDKAVSTKASTDSCIMYSDRMNDEELETQKLIAHFTSAS